MNRRRQLFAWSGAVTALGALLVSAAGSAHGDVSKARPVIGRPTTVPAQAVAGKRLVVTYKVTRSDTHRALTKGALRSQVTVAGARVATSNAFRGGTARVGFVVPAAAQGKTVKLQVTVSADGRSATRTTAIPVRGAPTLAISAASAVEGNTGTTTLSFAVRLSAASALPVTVAYTTSDGSAASPGDYASAHGSLTFAPGETGKTISVGAVADLAIEPDETFTVTLSDPVNATIATGTATGTITNDDTAVPVPAGQYKGATQEGNYVFLTVTPDRTVTGFRVNDLPQRCSPGDIQIVGGVDWSRNTFPIADDGSFTASGEWRGSDVQGDAEWTYWSAKLTATFNGSTVSGTITVTNELNYKGTHFTCTTGEERWSATLQG
jgi:hypothetical protein